LTNFAC